jgi:hypothetical protein
VYIRPKVTGPCASESYIHRAALLKGSHGAVVKPLPCDHEVMIESTQTTFLLFFHSVIICNICTCLHSYFLEGIYTLVMLGAWVIWKHRNSCVLNGATLSVTAALLVAKEEALLWSMAGARGLSLLHAIGTLGV